MSDDFLHKKIGEMNEEELDKAFKFGIRYAICVSFFRVDPRVAAAVVLAGVSDSVDAREIEIGGDED